MKNASDIDLFDPSQETDLEVKHAVHSWMISYADMITLLLCFFILFFRVDDSTTGEGAKQSGLLSLIGIPTTKTAEENKENAPAPQLIPSTASKATPKTNQETSSAEPKIDLDSDTYIAWIHKSGIPSDLASTLLKSKTSSVVQGEKDLVIEFPKAEFFEKSSSDLTPLGKESVQRAFELLAPYGKKIYVEIEGHADATPVVSKNRFKNNVELSTLRALTVYNYFVERGFDANSLSVIGHGEHRPSQNKSSTYSSTNKSFERRVTFRVEARGE